MKECGDKERDTVEENKFGTMEVFMRVTGKIILLMVQVDWYTQTVMFMKDIGKMIKHTVKENIFTWMELNMKVNGLKINNMALVKKDGQI